MMRKLKLHQCTSACFNACLNVCTRSYIYDTVGPLFSVSLTLQMHHRSRTLTMAWICHDRRQVLQGLSRCLPAHNEMNAYTSEPLPGLQAQVVLQHQLNAVSETQTYTFDASRLPLLFEGSSLYASASATIHFKCRSGDVSPCHQL